MSRHDKFNKKFPVLCFRASPKLKEVVRKFGVERGFVDGDGNVIVNNTLNYIVEDYFRINGVMVIKYESKYDGVTND